ncbi:hypothetical protein HZY86_01280 [Aerococcaceae bacterium DSM 111020]|nr:hypothetical protein [Aerococcaceae bacterium DSM 111020]
MEYKTNDHYSEDEMFENAIHVLMNTNRYILISEDGDRELGIITGLENLEAIEALNVTQGAFIDRLAQQIIEEY